MSPSRRQELLVIRGLKDTEKGTFLEVNLGGWQSLVLRLEGKGV